MNLMGKTFVRVGYAALALLALGAMATGHMIVQEIEEALAGAWTAADSDAAGARLPGGKGRAAVL